MDFKEFKETMEGYKKTGPAIGWFCSYTPEEVLHAAGYNTYGIRSSSGHEDDDVHLGRNLCSYVHSIFGGALNGEYDYLDGVVIAHGCECMRRLYDGWISMDGNVRPKFAFQLDIPHVNTQLSVDYFKNVLQDYITHIEKHSKKQITKDSLINSVKVYNKTRSLLKRLYDLRKRNNPPVSGAQVMKILDICLSTPKEKFNEVFEKYLTTMEEKKGGLFSDYRTRIMIYGGMFNPDLISFVESSETQGVVVCEDACNGIRYFEREVDLDVDEDPVKAISRRYLNRMPCPRIAGRRTGEKMPENLLNLVKEYNAEGVIYYVTKRCENLYWEFPFIKKTLDEHNIPLKRLEGDISGDVRKREIKSFIELIEF